MVVTHRLSLDLAQAARHLACLDAEDVRHIFAALPEAPGSPASARQYFGRLAEVAATLELKQRSGCGVFVTVNAMQGRRRRRSDVSRIRALWVERDRPGPPLPLTPSLVIATSPGRSHDYLLTDGDDALSPMEAHTLNRRGASRCGADPCATDPARLLRLAGTWNLKRSPFLATISNASGHSYSLATLRAAFPALDREAHSGEPAPLAASRPAVARQYRLPQSGHINDPERYLDAVVRSLAAELSAAPEGARNMTLNRVAFRLARLGIDISSITAELGPVAERIGLGNAEIMATIRSATRGARG
jgi:hypothetical protein